MATPGKKQESPPAPRPAPARDPLFVRAVLAIYRFLASLKLAVISIASLAATLAFATFFEKEYGSDAVQLYIYQSVGFAVLLALLAINILCAATIRFPWSRRQTGFVVTHLGLLVLIFGSFWGFHYSDEGRVGGVEGSTLSQLVRRQSPVLRVREIDKATGRPIDPEYVMPFDGGVFDWPAGRYRQVTRKGDPFKLAVKNYLAAALPKLKGVSDSTGSPVVRIVPKIKPPGADSEFSDVPIGNEQWLEVPTEYRLNRVSERAGPARVVFYYVDRQEQVDDFLKPPAASGELGAARLHYDGKDGKRRSVDVKLDGLKPGSPVALPDSELSAEFLAVKEMPLPDRRLFELLGEAELHVVEFGVKKGTGPSIKHTGFASLPAIPSVIPTSADEPGAAPTNLLDVSYYLPPHLSSGGGMSGNFGVIEVMGDATGKLYYRVFGRDTSPPPSIAAGERPGVLRAGPAPLRLEESVVAFGGSPNMPMTLTFAVEAYFPKGRLERIYEPFELPIGQKSTDFAAVELELTTEGATKTFWVSRTPPPELEVHFRPFNVGDKVFEVAYDFDRKPLGFSLFLKKFRVGFDPGSSQASSFQSDVFLTDEAKGIKDQPVSIWMNNPLTHRDLTFYQSSYDRARDPDTGERTGDFISVFQVGHDAGRPLKYVGSLLIVLGTFLQFYMRAGVFTDGGKSKGDHQAADRARRLLAKKEAAAEGQAPATDVRHEKTKRRGASEDII